MLKQFFISSKNPERESYIWNLIGSTLNAFQSVIMLVIITRVTSLNDAGIFSIAYANSVLLLNIGKYGMRNYQVSDYKSVFSFSEYKNSRIITSLSMLIVSALYVLIAAKINDYSVNKSLIIFVMCIYKTIDALEDVYHGLYQKNNRLDIAGKAMSFRMAVTLIVFGASIIISKSLLVSLSLTTLISGLICMYTIIITYDKFKQDKKASGDNITKLLKICFPLFLSLFLSFYINNAPKYAIDSLLNDELQACYGFIVMPVFIIELLNGFIFNPIIYRLTNEWNTNKIKAFKKAIAKQTVIIFLITALCEAAAYIAGIPVLSFLYNTDLSQYKSDLLILLLAGGGLALAGFFVTILTIMRKQKFILFAYGFVAIAALILSGPVVKNYSITGASFLYLFLMLLLSLFFIPAILLFVHRQN